MTKFLSRRSRATVSMLLYVCGLLTLGSYILLHLKSAPSWAELASTTLTLLAVGIMLALGLIFIHSEPTAYDLLRAAKKRLGEEQELMMEWSRLEVREASFNEMSMGMKVFYVFCLVSGVAFCAYGLVDIAGFAGPPMRLPAAGGKLEPIPYWASGTFEVLIGVISLIMTQIARINIVDKIDEEFRELLRRYKGGSIH